MPCTEPIIGFTGKLAAVIGTLQLEVDTAAEVGMLTLSSWTVRRTAMT